MSAPVAEQEATQELALSGVVPGYLVAYDVAHPSRPHWEGVDMAFTTLADAEQFLAGRRRTWPDEPFQLYCLIPVPAAALAQLKQATC